MEQHIRPDLLDEIGAFRAGYRHGVDYGEVSAAEADGILRKLPTTIPITSDLLTLFCNGSIDGANRDNFLYLLSFIAKGVPMLPNFRNVGDIR